MVNSSRIPLKSEQVEGADRPGGRERERVPRLIKYQGTAKTAAIMVIPAKTCLGFPLYM